MDTSRREIIAFHEKITPALRAVLARYDGRAGAKEYQRIAAPCRRLLQKCSCKSVQDTSRLCALAYWLYIYGEKALALEICEQAHGTAFPADSVYWSSGVQNIYGLEVRIARELFGEDRRAAVPPELTEHFCSKKLRRRMRWPAVLREAEIAACTGPALEPVLLCALYELIGCGETGFYPELDCRRGEIEKAIGDYIECLKTI